MVSCTVVQSALSVRRFFCTVRFMVLSISEHTSSMAFGMGEGRPSGWGGVGGEGMSVAYADDQDSAGSGRGRG